MRHFIVFFLLVLTAFQYSPLIAQKTSNDWRITKRIRTETNGQKFTFEYSYTEDGRIKTVKYLTPAGVTTITISDFTFTRNGQPSAYLITWNGEGATAHISLTYDDQNRIKELRKTTDDRAITAFTYTYTDKTIVVVEKKISGANQGTVKDNTMSYYTEQGDYNETVSDAASQTITSTITLKEGNRNRKIIPDDLFGGFDAPRLLGVTAFGSEPDVKAEKNDQGLVTAVVWTNRTGSRKNEYVYTKINNTGTVTPQDPEVAKANEKPYVEKPRVTGRNIFDARKNFVKAPIKFIPFTVTPDAAQKGFKMDSVYTWTAPDGKVKQASGAEILNQVNDMEKELNLRGHTLRKRNAFSGLSFKLINPNAALKTPQLVAKNVKMVQANNNLPGNKLSKIPVINTKRNKLPDIPNALATTIGSDVGVYFGNVTGMAGEFQGSISTTGMIDNSKCNKQCPLDLTLSLDAKMISSLNITNCILEISDKPDRKPNDTENTLATANFNFRKPAAIKAGTENMTINGEAPPSFHTLYYFPVKLQDLSKLAMAVVKPVVYYAYVKFYNDKGALLYYSSYNTAILENKIDAPLFIKQDKNVKGSFDDAFMDPTGMFGVYYASKNINAAYATSRDELLMITETTHVSGDIELGAQYYNFWHLLDDDHPKTTRRSFISASFSAEYTNRYNSMVPGIRIPGAKKSNEMNGYPGYEVNYSLYEQNFDKSSPQDQIKTIAYTVFDERFFIGPVPCRITVDVKGNARLTRIATMDTLTDGSVAIATSVTPHLDLTLTGAGGVDAAIAYARVVTDVKVIEMDLPIVTRASKDADIAADLKISALSGQIYFTAGLCIPIPWFDDICTDFRVDIFNWTGPNKTYPLVK